MAAAAVVELLLPRRFSAATQAGPLRDGQCIRLAGSTMGTRWSLSFVSRDPEDAARVQAGIEALLVALNAQLSHWDPRSAVGRYNRLPVGSWQTLPAELLAVLDAAQGIATASKGALDPTLGALVNLWGYGPAGPVAQAPAASDLANALACAGWSRLHRDGALLWQPGGLQLDLSAIAKGHAVDHLADWLSRHGHAHHLVEIGGELRGQGVKPDGSPWWVSIDAGPGIDTGIVTRIALDGLSIATSGDAWRHREQAGERLAHTLDPRTGWPLRKAAAAVTVIHPNCAQADGWATALTVLGPQTGLSLADQRGLAVRWQLHGDGAPGPVIDSLAWRAMVEAEP